MSRVHKVAFLASAILGLTLSFQNCSGDLRSHTVKPTGIDSRLSGNGGGYGGKVTYLSQSATQTCSDGTSVEAAIEIENGVATLIRENCMNVPPRPLPLSSVRLMPHNAGNLVYLGTVFDDERNSDRFTSILCRGEETDTSGQREVVDALIRRASNGEYFGRVILGVYEPDGALSKTYDMGEVPLRPPNYVADMEIYSSMTITTGEIFTLRIRLPSDEGMLSYTDNLPKPGSSPTPGVNSVDQHTVNGLECFRQ